MVALTIVLVGLIAFGGFSHVIVGSTEAFLLALFGGSSFAEIILDLILCGNMIGGSGIFALLS
jgi:formate/nitrite transporter FocA (FNT family)